MEKTEDIRVFVLLDDSNTITPNPYTINEIRTDV